MEKTITYLGVDSIQYIFTKDEIMDALMEVYKIKHSYDFEFAVYEPYDDTPAHAELVIRYTKEKPTEKYK